MKSLIGGSDSLGQSPIGKLNLTAKCPARQSRNRNSEYLPQRRQGRKGRKITVKKFSKIIHLFPPNLACFAPLRLNSGHAWRESIPRVRVFQVTGKFERAAQILQYSSTKSTKVETLIIRIPYFAAFAFFAANYPNLPLRSEGEFLRDAFTELGGARALIGEPFAFELG